MRWSEIARKLGVDRATISRDVKMIKKAMRDEIDFRHYLKEVLIPEIAAELKRKRLASKQGGGAN